MKHFLVFTPLLLLISQCTNIPVLSQLVNSRMSLALKTSYESNDPYANTDTFMSKNLETVSTGTMASDIGTATAISSKFGSTGRKYYIDLAEIRLATGRGLPSGVNPEDYFQFIARDRTLFCTDFSALNGKILDTCFENNGAGKLESLMGSNGYSYKVSDVYPNIYRHIALYFRRLVTYPYRIYGSDGSYIGEGAANFDNREITGLDVEGFYNFAPNTDSTTSNPLMFPLENTGLDLIVPDDEKPYTLEVRVFLNNLYMLHYVKDAETATRYGIYVGISDWKNTQSTTFSEHTKLGGNIITTARIYVPGQTGTITATNLTDNTATKDYLVVHTSTLSTTVLPTAAASISGTSTTVKNLPAGTYNVYHSCDNSATDTNSASRDGYPETLKSCGTVTVQSGVDTAFNANTAGCDACP